jgi:hypothetical protein
MDSIEMAAFQHREQTGYLPEETEIVPDFDASPEELEIIALVNEGYRQTNASRREQIARDRIAVLEQALRDNGIEIPEEL